MRSSQEQPMRVVSFPNSLNTFANVLAMGSWKIQAWLTESLFTILHIFPIFVHIQYYVALKYNPLWVKYFPHPI